MAMCAWSGRARATEYLAYLWNVLLFLLLYVAAINIQKI